MEFLICDKLNEGLFNVNTKSDKQFVLEKITLSQLCNTGPIFTKPKVQILYFQDGTNFGLTLYIQRIEAVGTSIGRWYRF